MRHLLLSSLAALAWLGVFSLQQTFAAPDPDRSDKANFSGIWTLDLRASMSLDPLMTQIGATFFDRKYAAWTKLKATLEQTDGILKVATRGPGNCWEQLPSTPKQPGLGTTSSSSRRIISEPNRGETAN